MNQKHSPLKITGAAVLAAVAAAVLVTGTGGGSGGTAPALATSQPPQEVFEHAVSIALPSVVQIQTDKGLGSGIALDALGDIVTNAHVVAGASRFLVTDADGHESQATLRGVFKPDDVAVIHTRARLRPADFGDSSRLKIGQLVLAIGNPLGLQSSVTQGIVSARSRTVSEGDGVALPSVIQTSAAINPGNSGGALVDLEGHVVGMPTLAATDPEVGDSAAPGIGFAISANSVRDVVRQIVAHGRVTRSGRASLGVELRSDSRAGARVVAVSAGGASARAGIRRGDLIVAIAGEPTPTVDDVATVLASLRPAQRAPVSLIAGDGARRTVTVRLGEIQG